MAVIFFGKQGDVLFLQPLPQLLKGQHGVDEISLLRLLLLGDTGTNEDGLGIAVAPFDLHAVGLQGREHRSQTKEGIRIVLSHQEIHTGTAGGDQDIRLFLPEDALVLIFYNGGADGRLLHIPEAQLHDGLPQRGDPHPGKRGGKGGRDADIYRRSHQQHPHLFHVAGDLLGILRADGKALAA